VVKEAKDLAKVVPNVIVKFFVITFKVNIGDEPLR
jgi:hypothetical protein